MTYTITLLMTGRISTTFTLRREGVCPVMDLAH